jgi:hypothetical protein
MTVSAGRISDADWLRKRWSIAHKDLAALSALLPSKKYRAGKLCDDDHVIKLYLRKLKECL